MVQSLEEIKRRRQSTEQAATSAPSRIPPQNLQAEASLLGAMLLSGDAITTATEICDSGDFYKPAHARVFEAIVALVAKGDPADPLTVADVLERNGELELVGGRSALLALTVDTPATSNAGRYAAIIKEHATLRRLIAAAGEITELGYSGPEDVTGVLDQAEELIFKIAENKDSDTLRSIGELIEEGFDRLAQLYDRGEAIIGVPTGYIDLDERLSGLQKSALYVVGARPAMGKTAFALGMASNAAMKANVPTLVFSLEMSHEELANRILVSEAKVDGSRVKNGQLKDADWHKIHDAMGRLGSAPLFIDDNAAVSLMDIRNKARRVKARYGLGLIIIDYLQLMVTKGKTPESRQTEIAEMSRGLKILARELEVPVVALAQLSRALEQRSDKRPMLSDLRESGAIEQDADVVMFLYRDDVYDPESPDQGTAEVIVAKHRSGPTGMAKLAYMPTFARFENMAVVN